MPAKSKKPRHSLPAIRTFRVVNETWSFALFVRVGGTVEDSERWAAARIGVVDWTKRGCAARTYTKGGNASVAVWFSAPVRFSDVAHEAFHAVAHVLKTKGNWPLTDENEESFAYLLDWTVREIGRRVW